MSAAERERFAQLQRLEAAVLATADQQPQEVLELCELPDSDADLTIDLLYLMAHPAFTALATAVLLSDGGGRTITVTGRLGETVHDVAEFLRARDARAGQ